MPTIHFKVRAFGMDMAARELERSVDLPFPPSPGMLLKGLRADGGRVQVQTTEWDLDAGSFVCRLDAVGSQYADLGDALNALGPAWQGVT